MSDPTLALLGKRVARSQERWVSGLPPVAYDPGPVHARRRARERWILTACGLAGAAAAAALLFSSRPQALRYEARGLVAGQAEEWIAPETQGRLEFSDGSRVTVAPAGRVQVRALRSNGALFELEQGSLTANIVHRETTTWEFVAGPYEVAIVGTSFDMSWNEQGRALTLRVEEGAVRISGCSVAALRVVAGQTTTLRCPSAAVLQQAAPVSSSDPVQPVDSAPLSAANAPARQQEAPSSSAEPAPAAPASAPTAAPDWRALIAVGRLREAYAAADATGFESACDQASSGELLDLADAAAVAGRADRARSAWLAARRRFPGTQAAAMAAYKLGTLASDRSGASGDARAWLEVYLRETPSGGLAREALGRLLEIEVRTGNTAAARARAELYLRQYPDGPQAALARKVLTP